jgi:hypothetical protein
MYPYILNALQRALSIALIVVIELFLIRSVKNLNFAAWCVIQNLPVL